jgi:hypothetical protein
MKLETWLSLTAAIVSAIGTGLAAYAALEATRTSQRLATLQALDTFRVAIEKKDRGAGLPKNAAERDPTSNSGASRAHGV